MGPPEPRFVEWDNVLSAAQCSAVIEAATPRLQRSTIVVRGKPVLSPGRTTSECVLQRDELLKLLDEEPSELEATLHVLSGVLPSHREPWRVVRYQRGQEYLQHYDWFPPESLPPRELGGQRTTTVIIYLCDVFTGGSTNFPLLARGFQPVTGKLLLWNNLAPDGRPLQLALHEGVAPWNEAKWILTTWYRQHPYLESLPP